MAEAAGGTGLLSGQRALVLGVANKRSIAWGIAQALAREGAELCLAYHSQRSKEHIEQLVEGWAAPPLLLACDVLDDASVASLAVALERQWGSLDTVIHSIAHAETGDLSGRFSDTSREGWRLALEVSAYSLPLLARAVRPLWSVRGRGSLIALTSLGSERVMPSYNVMGVAKATLEASVRYLASDLGREGIRVNAISAGPVKTLAAAGVKGLRAMLHHIEEHAPLATNITAGDVGNAAVFLASDWSEHITGQVLFVDAGYHVMAT